MSGRLARGVMVLVVGPSGAGKDTLIAGARAALAGDGAYVFPRREITRPAAAGGEAHIAITRAEFERRRAAGFYALSWQAHGLGYGVPATMLGELAAGRAVVVNVSRSVIAEARQRFDPLHVVRVAVDEAVLRGRLTGRGREDDAAIDARLARVADETGLAASEIAIDNNGPIEHAIRAFADFLRSLRAAEK
jgi:phosphonate metabolism protein PhnN/1,5-bisphosphokinase (PRPP-forming)